MGFGGLYTSVSGLYANKKSLDTVAHNMANVNNPNYVRQSATHKNRPYSSGDTRFQRGTGVSVSQIRQIRDEFLDVKLRREMAETGYYSTKFDLINEVESIFNDMDSRGLQKVMDDFWNGWSELTKDPESLTVRGIVHESSVALTTSINHLATQLDDLQTNLNKEMINRANETNGLLEKVASLNKQIKIIEAHGPHVNANDLRDQRNGALDRLSELIPVQIFQSEHGEELLSLFGRNLVGGDSYNPIEIRVNKKGHGEVYWSHVSESIELQGLGELGGYIEARDNLVVEYRERLNILTQGLADGVNGLHEGGKGLDWEEGEEEKKGIPFFIINNSKDPAASLIVNPELGDFKKIGASSSGAKGDGQKAKEILDLRNKALFGKYQDYKEGSYEIEKTSLTLTMDEFYRDLSMTLGLEGGEAKAMLENQAILIGQIKNKKQEISSVSLDEEMTDMLKFQHSYVANSRVINAIDEMMENIINRLGLVGR